MTQKKQLDEKELQQKYLEFQMISNQVKQLQRGVQILDEQASEISSVFESLNELQKVKEGAEIFFPITSGIFAKGELKDNAELIVSVGSNVAVVKDIEATKKLLGERQAELVSEREELTLQLQSLVGVAQQYQDEIEKLIAEENV